MNKGQEILEAVDERGEIGFIDAATKPLDSAGENMLAVRLGNGETVFVEASRLTAIATDKFLFAGSFQAVQNRAVRTSMGDTQTNSSQSNFNRQNLTAIDARTNASGEIVVPLIAEEISVSRKIVETGGIRVHKIVSENVRTIDEPIVREHIEVERVEINQFVETAPAIRYEGEKMIVPVLEEVVVTQKRLLLREEIHLIKRREEISNPQEITLRREEINLENIDAENDIEPG